MDIHSLAPPCFHCKREVAKIDGLYSGAFFIEPGGNKVHEECWGEFKRATAAKCLQCKQPVLDAEYYELEDGNVHNGCWREYCLENYERCAYNKCKQPLCEWKCEPSDFSSGEFPLCEWKSGKGNFSGEVDDVAGVSVHEECLKLYMDQLYITENIVKPDWEKVAVPDCVQCGKAVAKVEGMFSGRSHEIKNNAHVHEECWDAYCFEHHCFQCKDPLDPVEGKFSGKHHITEHGKVHNECWEIYCREYIPPCVFCGEPCCEFGKYSGMIYKFEDSKECHAECFGAYAKGFVPESSSTILVYEDDISRKFGDLVVLSREEVAQERCPICNSARKDLLDQAQAQVEVELAAARRQAEQERKTAVDQALADLKGKSAGAESDAAVAMKNAEQMKKEAEAMQNQAKRIAEEAEQEKANLKAQLANIDALAKQKLDEANQQADKIIATARKEVEEKYSPDVGSAKMSTEEKENILQQLRQQAREEAKAQVDAALKEARDAKEQLERERETLLRDIYTERSKVEEQWAEINRVKESQQRNPACPVCGGGEQKPASQQQQAADVQAGSNCRHCTVPVNIVSDQFEGTYFTSQDEMGTYKVHTECWEEFSRNAAANKSLKAPGQLIARVLSFEDALHTDGSKTHDFVITVTTPTGAKFTLRRRFSEFQALFQMVKEKYNFQSIKEFSFPDHRGFFNFDTPQQIATRRMQAFDDLCQRLVALDPIPAIVEDFLRQEIKA